MMQPVELALDVAAIVMKNGGSTALADRAFQKVLAGCGVNGISAVWRLDLVAACGMADGQSVTVVRPVGALGINLTRASAAALLAERVQDGDVGATALPAEIERINNLQPPYGRRTMVVAAACSAMLFSQLAEGDWGACGIAFVAAGAGQLMRSLLRTRIPAAPVVTLVCGMLSACIAAAGLRLGLSHTAPAAAIASVVYAVPGLALINGFRDIMSQKYLLVGLERIADAAFVFLVLAIAIAFANAVIM